MSIPELILELQRAEIDIQLAGDELEVSCPAGQVLPVEVVEKLTHHKNELLQWLRINDQEYAGTSIPRSANEETYPLSPAQKRIWMIDQFKTGQHAYNMYASCIIKGDMQWELFVQAWKQLVVRHEILRTCFIEIDGDIRQQVHTSVPDQPVSCLVDCRHMHDKENYIRELTDSLLSTRFKLDKCPLYQYRLIQTGKQEYIFILVLHHIITDGLSMPILSNELIALYEAGYRKISPVLPELPIQYKDYCAWITQQLPKRVATDLAYWEKRFSGTLPLLNLPIDFTRPSFRSFKGAAIDFLIDSETTAAIQQLAGTKKITVASLALAFFKIVLFKWSGQQDITIGIASTGRDHIDLEHLVGLFVNTLPIRTRLHPDMRVQDCLHMIHQQVLEAMDHQLLPFESIVDHLAIERDPARNPLFDVFYTFVEQSASPVNTDGAWQVFPYYIERHTSRFDLLLEAILRDGQLLLRIEFDTALFLPSTIQQLGNYYKDLIRSSIADPTQLLMALPAHPTDIVHAASGHLPLPSFSAPELAMAAVLQNDSTLSYGSLFHEAAKLSDRLIRGGMKPGQPVALCTDLEEEKLIALLAIFRTRATYIPLTAEWPADEWFLQKGIVNVLAGEDQKEKTALLPAGVSIHQISYKQQTGMAASANNLHIRRLNNARASFEKPVNDMQQLLADIWQEVLHTDKVGIHDNFFTAGGDSMKVIRMVNEFNRRSGMQLKVKDVFLHQTISAISASTAKNEAKKPGGPDHEKIEREISAWKNIVRSSTVYAGREVEDAYPMSDIEQGLVFHNYMHKDEAVYHNQIYCKIRDADFDFECFCKAFSLLVEKHNILRTSYDLINFSTPLHIVYYSQSVDLRISFTNISDKPAAEQRIFFEKWKEADQKESFEVTDPGLWRLRIFQVSEDLYGIFWIFHHAILDGWSYMSLFTELTQVYHKLRDQCTYSVRPLQATYKDYVIDQWQVKSSAVNRSFWKSYLQDYERTPLPLAKVPTDTLRFDVYTVSVSKPLRTALYQLADREDVAIREIFLAAFLYLIKLTSGTSGDVVTGLVTHGRPQVPDADKILGCFLNTVPVRMSVQNRISIKRLVREVKQNLVTLKAYDSFPLSEIVKTTGHTAGNNPIFDILFNYMDFYVLKDVHEQVSTENSDVESFSSANTLFDFHIHNTGGATILHLKYIDKYTREEIEKITGCYIDILKQMAGSDMLDAGKVSDRYAQCLLKEWNDTQAPYPADQSLCDLWNEQVATSPDSIVLVVEDQCISRGVLEQRAEQLAEQLVRGYGILAGDLVAIIMDPGIDMLIAILGILKAGAAYIPIDPSFPSQRMNYMLDDACTKAVIVNHGQSILKNTAHQAQCFSLPAERDEYWEVERSQSRIPPGPADLAYVIYTSGSTGTPKGVMINHAGVVNRIDWMWKAYAFTDADKILQKTPNIFDVSVWELLMPLCYGCEMVIAPKEVRYDPALMMRYIARHAITAIHFVPGVYNTFLDVLEDRWHLEDISSLKRVFASGEALLPAIVHKHHRWMKAGLYNLYGPTEASVEVSYFDTSPGNTIVPIGRPIPNMKLYILDEYADLLPPGIAGEIGISGIGLARGYINNPGLTATAFIANPFERGERIYKTGDMGRWLPDGNIEYLGRKDHQVKIRGHRIELGEIENVLLQHPDVEEAVVVTRKEHQQADQLVAFVAGKTELSARQLTTYLSARLTSYMIPAWFYQLDALPMTASGKVNRKALPSIDMPKTVSATSYIAPRNETEKLLAEVWAKTLGREQIGIAENFFEIGGDSIKVIQVVSRMGQRGYSLDTKTLFRLPVIEKLAPHVKKAIVAIDQSAVIGPVPITPVQSFFFASGRKNPHHFNQAVMLKLKKCWETDRLRMILQKILEHHDQLRAVFTNRNGGWVQEIAGLDLMVKLETVDFTHNPSVSLEAMANSLQASMMLEKGSLVQAAHCKMPGYDILLIAIHHLVIDGVSWRILLEDLETLMQQCTANLPLQLPAKTCSFREYAVQSRVYAEKQALQSQSKFWKAMDARMANVGRIPILNTAVPALTHETETISFRLNEEQTTALLTEVHKPFRTETPDILLAALTLALKDIFNFTEVAFMMESHGREGLPGNINISRTVGWFTSLYPVLLSLQHTGDIKRFIKEVKETLRSIPAKGIGYGFLHYGATPPPHLAAMPQWLFNYLGQFDQDISTTAFTIAQESTGNAYAPDELRIFDLECTCMVVGSCLHFSLAFGGRHYHKVQMEKLLQGCKHHLEMLIGYCKGMAIAEFTPSDFGNIEFSIDELDRIFE